jgi:predicted nucleic acid-binding protein
MASSRTSPNLRVLVDSSVFFAAAYSTSGPAHALILEASPGACLLQISDFVIEETRRNLNRHAPAAVAIFDRLAQLPCIRLVAGPSKTQVVRVAKVVNLKDAPIVAAAMRAKSHYLATHDRELLRQATDVAKAFSVSVVSPAAILPILRASP